MTLSYSRLKHRGSQGHSVKENKAVALVKGSAPYIFLRLECRGAKKSWLLHYFSKSAMPRCQENHGSGVGRFSKIKNLTGF
ncbi:Uncharacterized protein TCM_035658 [Theobroma cacao]|uniref:Uncharacterized protein n=1 Tax=Theobroma cacao TaxID=3641 RepID=A0A061FHI2_THECC|nr:Uncharacterized protein TCM_035658 [Theobroma cacao]